MLVDREYWAALLDRNALGTISVKIIARTVKTTTISIRV
jgi:hypothetical protein